MPAPARPSARSIFQEDWWLEAASGGAIERVEVAWDGRRVGSLSYVRRTRAGSFRILAAPPYTHTLGPVFDLPDSRPTQHAMNVQRVVRELRAKLPPHDRFVQQLDPDDGSAFAFALAGCSVGQLFTFRVDPATSPGDLLAAIDPATRRLVKASGKQLGCDVHDDVDRLLKVAACERPADENRHDFNVLARTCEAAIRRGNGTILSAANAAGTDVASVFLVWDARVLYYLVPFRDRALSKGGANAALLWEAMALARAKNLVFDFDGYSSIGSARFLSSFGVKPIPRALITYRSARCVAIDFVRSVWRPRGPAGLRVDFDLPVSAENARVPPVR